MIKALSLSNFRNYGKAEVSFSGGINLFCGENGQGKTNLLEAVYMLGMLSSFRKADPSMMVKKGERSFKISGDFSGAGAGRLLLEKGERGWKSICADGISYRKKLDYLGKVRMVVFSPDEIDLIQGSPEGRRNYLDRTCFNLNHHHLRHLKAYRRVLKHRNNLLKRGVFRGEEYDAWTERLALTGAKVVSGRIEFIDRLNEKLSESHPFLERDRVSLAYSGPVCGAKDPERLILEALSASSGEERARRVTVAGPHRDDVEIGVNGIVAKSFSSRGEMRSILLSLKTAETSLYREAWDEAPLILLDDVASELDIGRRKALIEYIRSGDSQVLMTTTEAENIPLFGKGEDTLFMVSHGMVRQ